MRTLLQTISRRYEVLDWDECSTEGGILQFHNQSSALDFLRQFLHDSVSMMTLRSLLTKFSLFGSISRLSDHEVLDQLAHQLVLVRLRIAALPLFEIRASASGSFEESSPKPLVEPPKPKAEAAFAKQKKAWIEIESLG